ncbi:MAG TPA: phosphoenolpyruvate carboxykinase (ATP) [Phycisphaerales bacterium]|nr:phosphoenolpyruvate carboxykinase (ATP) [Phycisphaerales bacterium]
MASMMTSSTLELAPERVLRNLSTPVLVEHALSRGEGVLASNGTLSVTTGARTGRSPNDKYLEDSPEVTANIWWGKVNQKLTPAAFDELEKLARAYMSKKKQVYQFDGFVGADTTHRLSVRTYTEQAWHSLFVKTLFIEPTKDELAGFDPDWTIINCGKRKLTKAEAKRVGSNPETGICIAQSLSRRLVLIFGTEYAGEMKKSMFYAMNYDMPEVGVFPMHCSANVDMKDDSNVALFFGLSGTGKTTLSADPQRALIGDDEHGWSSTGVFNFEGGCYAKCINLTKEGEPQIWDAIKFGSVLENVLLDPDMRTPNYDSNAITDNTRVTYPVDFIPGARIPSVGKHPKNVIFLTADAFGVLPPVSKLTREQAMYYFINGYTSKLAGTEAGVKEPQPNFSPCFGGPFLPRPPRVYADMLAERIDKHGANVWLVNTGWSGGPYGVGARFKLKYTRAMVTAILDGSLAKAKFENDPVFGLAIPSEVPGSDVPKDVLQPRNTWKDKGGYDEKAKDLAKRFRENDGKFEMPEKVRAAGPRG